MAFIHRRGLLLGGAALGASALGASALALPAWAQAPAPAAAPPAAPTGPHTHAPLPYAFDANEASIDARTMELHWRFHHGGQVAGLNRALAGQDEFARLPLDQLLMNLSRVPENIRTAIRNNGGGHANHSMFWEIMGGRGGEAGGDLRAAIDRDLGGWTEFRNRFNAASMSVFGSGWAFVTVTPSGQLAIVTKPGQDNPLMDGNRVLMGNDLWEHAYYLRYQNRRMEYVSSWWDVLNWDRIAARYGEAVAGTLRI